MELIKSYRICPRLDGFYMNTSINQARLYWLETFVGRNEWCTWDTTMKISRIFRISGASFRNLKIGKYEKELEESCMQESCIVEKVTTQIELSWKNCQTPWEMLKNILHNSVDISCFLAFPVRIKFVQKLSSLSQLRGSRSWFSRTPVWVIRSEPHFCS